MSKKIMYTHLQVDVPDTFIAAPGELVRNILSDSCGLSFNWDERKFYFESLLQER